MTSLELAQHLHQTTPLLVSHMDLPAELQLRRQAGETKVLRTRYAERLRRAGIRVIIGSIFVHPSYLPEMALSSSLAQIAALMKDIEESGDLFCLVHSAKQLDHALDLGQIAILLSLEGAEPLNADPSLLRIFYALGVRLLGLTWNDRTAYADGCSIPGGGLTPKGRALVEAAWSLGMVLDVSHLNDACFDELLHLGSGPVIASHSNCRALCSHPRNLTDTQVTRLAARGGVIGVNQIRFLVCQPSAKASLDALCNHIQRIVRLAGPGHAGLGLDLARDYMESLPKPRAYWQTWDPQEEDLLEDYQDLVRLTAALLDRGVSQETAAGILGENFLAFLRRTLL